MPEPTHIMDTGLPRFKGTESTEEKVNSLQNYLYMLLEELRYYLQHLTEDNFTAEGAQALVSQAISGKEGQSAITPAAQEIITLTEAPRFSSLDVDTASGKVRYTVEGDPTQYVLSFVKNGDTATYTWPDGFQCEVAIDSNMTQAELMLSTLIALCAPAKRIAEKPAPAKEPPTAAHLTFSSEEDFTLRVYNGTKNWDGTLEYSTDAQSWHEWDGTTTLSSVDGYLYVRGRENTTISGRSLYSAAPWVLAGTDISCTGNIETLLDYAKVGTDEPPVMGNYCFASLFRGCTSLTTAPALPATTLVMGCYNGMFEDCTSLTTAPALPATTLATSCYNGMFNGCTSLTTAPALPATALATSCYYGMFYGCTSLTTAPALPAAALAPNCYVYMFEKCTSLTTAPALPAAALAETCYLGMFRGCTSLTTAPALPATTLDGGCYYQMFNGCTSLTTAPALPATTLATSCYNQMFYGCSSLKLSLLRTEEYDEPYRIPVGGGGETATSALDNMFTGTGGTFTGTPAINTTYYTTNPPV